MKSVNVVKFTSDRGFLVFVSELFTAYIERQIFLTMLIIKFVVKCAAKIGSLIKNLCPKISIIICFTLIQNY